eukprot:32555_1
MDRKPNKTFACNTSLVSKRQKSAHVDYIYSYAEFKKQSTTRDGIRLSKPSTHPHLDVCIHRRKVIYTLHDTHPDKQRSNNSRLQKKLKNQRYKKRNGKLIFQSCILKHILNEWQCLTYCESLGHGARSIFRNIHQICHKFPKKEYYHTQLTLRHSKKQMFFLFQKYKSEQHWYSFTEDGHDNHVYFGISLSNLMCKMWDNRTLINIEDIKHIITHVNDSCTHITKDICIPKPITLVVKHLASRKYYQKIVPLSPRKVALLINGYMRGLDIIVPDCVVVMVFVFYGTTQYNIDVKYLDNGDIIMSQTEDAHRIVFSEYNLTFDTIYLFQMRIMECTKRKNYRSRFTSNSFRLGIETANSDEFGTCIDVKNNDMVEMTIDLKRNMFRIFINERLHRSGLFVPFIRKKKEVALYVPFIDMTGGNYKYTDCVVNKICMNE